MNNTNEMKNLSNNTSECGNKKAFTWVAVVFSLLLILAILVTAVATFSFTVRTFFPAQEAERSALDILASVIGEKAYYTPKFDDMSDAALKAYVSASGDKYAKYYTDAEYAEFKAENSGRYVGIGVTVQEKEIFYEGREISVLEISRISKDSPAMEGGLKVGNLIYSIVTEDGEKLVDYIGKEDAQRLIRGEDRSTITLCYLVEEEGRWAQKQITLTRSAVQSTSVDFRVSELDPSVGIVRIYQFDLTTPGQLCNAFDSLIAQGIEKFALDLRDNGGGDLWSVVACSSYFVKSGDVILTKDNKEDGVEPILAIFRNWSGEYASCSILTEDIGKYRNYEFVTLVNGNTASAAELFVSVLKDYKIAPMVGTQTFGKGSVQEYIPLAEYGMEGTLKITTSLYYPPCGKGYHGIGITPDFVVALDEGTSVNTIAEEDDEQLLCAIGVLM